MNGSKRSLQVNVRLSPDNRKILRQAAEQIWPGVPLSNSTLLLTLAHHKATEILDDKGAFGESDALVPWNIPEIHLPRRTRRFTKEEP